MKRVVIVGCPGAGKSTFARQLADILHIPLIHLDSHYWRPGWVRPPEAEWRQQLERLCQSSEWIMDGNYGSSLDIRLGRADTLIHLDFSTRLCLYRVIKRSVKGLGLNRSNELPVGCPERFDPDFLRFVWRYRSLFRQRDIEAMAHFEGERHRFTTPAKLNLFLQALKNRCQLY